MAASEGPRLVVEGLRVRSAAGEILKGIDLEVRCGEILAVIGPAGAGKTTFLRAVNRMTDLDPGLEVSGRVRVDGYSVHDPGVHPPLVRRRVGMVFSVPVPLPASILQNVAFGLALGNASKGEVRARVESALRAAYLWEEVKDRLDQSALNLSGGQQQRLCLARTLALSPGVLLLDEPCSGLDPISTRKIEEALQELKRDLAIVLVTNNVKQASRSSDRTCFFLFGELVEQGATPDLFTHPREERTRNYVTGRFG